MKAERILEDHPKQEARYWGKDEDVQFQNISKSDASCTSCQLVKWYPPLLTLSTVMAGVFCWLYVTKPVVVTKTMIPESDSPPSLIVKQDLHENRDLVVKIESETSQGDTLNPELGFLPGEENAPAPSFSDAIPGQGVEIVRVKRSERRLFKPLENENILLEEVVPDDEGEPEAPSAGAELAEEDTTDLSPEEEVEFQGEGSELSGDTQPVDASSHWDEEGEDLVREVAISLMGEIVTDSELDTKIIASSLDDLDLE